MNDRRATDATWYRVLDRFGLPTLLVLVLLGYQFRQGEQERQERRELLGGIRTAIEANTLAMKTLALEERDHADAVRATWPKVRLPAYLAAHPTPAASSDGN